MLNFSEGSFHANYQKLNRITTVKKEMIVITNIEGARGVDYIMAENAHVIMCFNPIYKSLVDQALGRGARRYGTVCSGTLIFFRNEILDDYKTPE